MRVKPASLASPIPLSSQIFLAILTAFAIFLTGCNAPRVENPQASGKEIPSNTQATPRQSERLSLPLIENNFSIATPLPKSWWMPSPGTSWQWQLSGEIDISIPAQMYDIDLFDAPQAVIDELHANGRAVVCYFSAGSWEDWRPDSGQYPPETLGKPLEGWQDERWLDIRQIDSLSPILANRLDLARQKGCDGVEADNVDGYINDTGFPLTAQDQLNFNIWLADQAHARNLSIGLKNDLGQIPDLLSHFDWALNEQCFEYDECSLLLPFIQAGKAVFGVEYNLETEQFCPQANAMNFDWLKKNLELDSFRVACR